MDRVQVPTGEPSPFNPDPMAESLKRGSRNQPLDGQMDLEDEKLSDTRSENSDSTSVSDEDRSNSISLSIAEDIAKFEDLFKGITKQYRIIDRIGEGTFSTVYKAEDLSYDQHENDWDLERSDSSWVSPPLKNGQPVSPPKKKRYVAIKKIYVTSSPLRIQNELELLHDLRSCQAICPLITAFRHQDQVIAVLPYYRHHDFRAYFRKMDASDMQLYFRSLFTALAVVHKQGILHRDVKPTNFLYDIRKQQGVLVDFGLAEREGTDSSYCLCLESASRRRTKLENSFAALNPYVAGYPKEDTRPSRRANRAGTRGFRAPEVLFKCTSQTTKIDVWSAGVILLTILSQRFPFFNSTDDVDAMIEIASIFGRRKMSACALLHGAAFECTIPTVGEKGFPLEKLVLWSTVQETLTNGEKMAVRFLERCLELDTRKRISAKEALQHEFLQETLGSNGDRIDEMEIIEQ